MRHPFRSVCWPVYGPRWLSTKKTAAASSSRAAARYRVAIPAASFAPPASPSRQRRRLTKLAVGVWPARKSCGAVGVASLLTPSTQRSRSEEHTSELQSRENLVCRLLLEKKKQTS